VNFQEEVRSCSNTVWK